MCQQIVHLLAAEFEICYREVRELLLQKESYQNEVDTQTINILLTFIESGVKDTSSRLITLATFIHEIDGLLPDGLSPLQYLTDQVGNTVDHFINQAVKINTCLEVFAVEQ